MVYRAIYASLTIDIFQTDRTPGHYYKARARARAQYLKQLSVLLCRLLFVQDPARCFYSSFARCHFARNVMQHRQVLDRQLLVMLTVEELS